MGVIKTGAGVGVSTIRASAGLVAYCDKEALVRDLEVGFTNLNLKGFQSRS